MGARLKEAKFPVTLNPFGTLYHPFAIHALLRPRPPEEKNLIFYEDKWHALDYAAAFCHADRNNLLDTISQSRNLLYENLSRARLLLLTYGTAHLWRRKSDDHAVANCHKLPGELFYRQRSPLADLTEDMATTVRYCREHYPNLTIMVSLSPVRHLALGLTENQLSKSVLRCALGELICREPGVYYFPAYEIMLDDLRDYRFYERDMIHPNGLAVDYIFEVFASAMFSPETRQRIAAWEKVRRAMGHRPRNASGNETEAFRDKIRLQLASMKKEYPDLDWTEEEKWENLS